MYSGLSGMGKVKDNFQYKRGQIFFSELEGTKFSEQGGVRPVVIIQNDIGNRYSPTIIVAPITSQLTKAKLPTHVEVDNSVLDRNSIILTEQLRTIDKRRLRKYIGVASQETMDKVNKALLISLELDQDRDRKHQLDLINKQLEEIKGLDIFICRWISKGGALNSIKEDVMELNIRIKELSEKCNKLNINMNYEIKYDKLIGGKEKYCRMVG